MADGSQMSKIDQLRSMFENSTQKRKLDGPREYNLDVEETLGLQKEYDATLHKKGRQLGSAYTMRDSGVYKLFGNAAILKFVYFTDQEVDSQIARQTEYIEGLRTKKVSETVIEQATKVLERIKGLKEYDVIVLAMSESKEGGFIDEAKGMLADCGLTIRGGNVSPSSDK